MLEAIKTDDVDKVRNLIETNLFNVQEFGEALSYTESNGHTEIVTLLNDILNDSNTGLDEALSFMGL